MKLLIIKKFGIANLIFLHNSSIFCLQSYSFLSYMQKIGYLIVFIFFSIFVLFYIAKIRKYLINF